MSKAAQHFKKRLLALRDRHGGVAEFVQATGFSRQTVENWMGDDEVFPGIDKLDRIATALGAEPWQIIAPENMPAARIAPDLLDLLSQASPDAIAAVRAMLEGFAVGREKRALSGRPAQKLRNLPKNFQKK